MAPEMTFHQKARHMTAVIVVVFVASAAAAPGNEAAKWTDLSEKKLDNQMMQHDQAMVNHVHEVRQHPVEPHVAHAQANVMEVDFKDAREVREIRLGGVKAPAAGATASVMAVFGLVVVAFVVVMVVAKVKSSRQQTGDLGDRSGAIDDYHWVDELNIIVNPMEEQAGSPCLDDEDQELPLRDDFSEGSELSDREIDLENPEDYEDLSSEDEDEVPGVSIASAAGVKELRSCRGLEWDDSTI